jgi:hypothetical protein
MKKNKNSTISLKKDILKDNISNVNLSKNIVNKVSEKMIVFNNNKNNKIFNVYQEYYKNGQTASGFGDFIRGSYFLMQFCEKYKIGFNIVINHPINKFLSRNIGTSFIPITLFTRFNESNLDKNPEMYVKFYEYLKEQPVKNNIIKTNIMCCPCDPISNRHKNMMREILNPSEQMNMYICEALEHLNLIQKQYIVIHIRSGDNYLINKNELNNDYFCKIKLMIESIINSKNKYLLISDNLNLKQKLVQHIPNIQYMLEPIGHFGEGVLQTDENIKNTLIDFYLITLSLKVFAFSCYDHGSGFSKWAAETFNIPYELQLTN